MPPKVRIVERDTGWTEFFKRAYEIREAGKAKVGVLADARGGAKHDGTNLTVAQVAVINEFGTEDGHVPERSFLRSSFDESRELLRQQAAQLIIRILQGKVKPKQAVAILGMSLVNRVRHKITDGEGVSPENAPSTIAQKGSSRPLVDTAQMLHAITYALLGGDGPAEEPKEGESPAAE